MDDLNRFFPVVPRNVPPDDLSSYLWMYADEAGAYRASQDSRAAQHAEWFVNTRMPVMRTLQGLGNVGQPLGQDPTATVNRQSGIMYVSAMWAQRAANAFLATVGASLIQVDGVVGGQTLTALRFVELRWYASLTGSAVQPDTGQTMLGTTPMPTRSGSGVALPLNFGNYLAGLTQVADPPPVSHPSSGGSGGSVDLPDFTPVATSVWIGIGQGIGLLALLGVGIYAYSRMR